MFQKKEVNAITIPQTPAQKAKFIMNILKTIEIQYTQEGIMAYVDTNNKKEEIPIDSKKFQSIVSSYYFWLCDEVVSASMVKNCIMSFQGMKFMEMEPIEQKTRLLKNKNENVLYIDKADNYYHYYKITKDGWSVEENGYKMFFRNQNQGEIPTPDSDNANVEKIFEYCRIPDNMKTIFLAYLGTCFIPNIKHPCLVLEGEKGSGKTTVSKFIKALVDPADSVETGVNFLPKDIQQIAYAYRQNYLLAFDNLVKLNKVQSDFLCTVISGGNYAKRKLFTDGDLYKINLCQPVILNGIKNIVVQDDLINRSIIMRLEKPDSDSVEVNDNDEEFVESFVRDREIILGGLFDILAKALKNYKPNSVKKRPRMAAFYEWGYYICEAWKRGYGEKFCEEYWALIRKQENIEDWEDELPHAILFILNSRIDKKWKGTMSELAEELRRVDEEVGLDGVPLYPIPLSKHLKVLGKYMKSQGISVEWGKTKDNCSMITLSLENE